MSVGLNPNLDHGGIEHFSRDFPNKMGDLVADPCAILVFIDILHSPNRSKSGVEVLPKYIVTRSQMRRYYEERRKRIKRLVGKKPKTR